MLSQKETEQIKKQIIHHIESSFPENKKNSAKRKIITMSSEELEEFLKQNKILKEQGQENPFRLIVSGQTPSYKIDENKNCLAILEINPISKAHALIIPKKPLKQGRKIPKYIINFADKVAKKIKSGFHPKDISISASNMFGETILNLLPVYKDETLDSKRKQAKPEELKSLQKNLEKKPRIKKPKTKKIDEKIWLPKRVP